MTVDGSCSGLVSWGTVRELGVVPGSAWACPTGPIEDVPTYEDLTAADVQGAVWRTQHIETLLFAEGYIGARVVDSQTGYTVTGRMRRCVQNPHREYLAPVLERSPIDLGGAKEIAAITSAPEGTRIKIKPTSVRVREADAGAREGSRMVIIPEARFLEVIAQGRVCAVNGEIGGRVKVSEAASEVAGKLSLWGAGWKRRGLLDVSLDHNGQMRKIVIFEGGLLRRLGVRLGSAPQGERDGSTITDPDDQACVLNAIARTLGFDDGWHGLNLTQTAARLYAGMGQRHFDPTTTLVAKRQ